MLQLTTRYSEDLILFHQQRIQNRFTGENLRVDFGTFDNLKSDIQF